MVVIEPGVNGNPPQFSEWTEYDGMEVRVCIPEHLIAGIAMHGLPEDLHPDLWPELFEFRTKEKS